MPINIRQKRPFLWRIQTRLKNFQTLLRTKTTQIKIVMSYVTSVAAAATTIRNGVVYTATGGTGRSKCLENKCTALNLKQHSVPNIFLWTNVYCLFTGPDVLNSPTSPIQDSIHKPNWSTPSPGTPNPADSSSKRLKRLRSSGAAIGRCDQYRHFVLVVESNTKPTSLDMMTSSPWLKTKP